MKDSSFHDEIGMQIEDQLNVILHDLNNTSDFFEDQRRNIGKAYALSGEILKLTKVGIAALKSNGDARAKEIEDTARFKFGILRKLNLPEDIRWQFTSEVGQEIVEFVVVRLLYPVLFCIEGHEMPIFPDFDELEVTPQAYLAGLGDVPGELGKLFADYLIASSELDMKEKLALRQRYLQICFGIHRVLDQYETTYPRVINATRRRGYSFRFSVLARMRDIIRREQERVISMQER